jgi:SAM-dependent methyltransferase
VLGERIKNVMSWCVNVVSGARRRIQEGTSELRTRASHPLDSNKEIALNHFYAGRYMDSLFRLRIMSVIWGETFFVAYNMGRCYLAKKDPAKAVLWLNKALATEEGDEIAYYQLKKVSRINEITCVPLEVARERREWSFDTVIRGATLDAGAYDNAVGLIKAASDTPMGWDILDLGCGAGALGRALRAARLGRRLSGIDCSPRAAAHCRDLTVDQLEVYNEVVCGDARGFLEAHENSFNCIAAFKYLELFGDLGALFKLCRAALKQRGSLVVAVLQADEGEDLQFLPQRDCFLYSVRYVAEMAQSAGMILVRDEYLRLQNGDRVVQCVISRE